MDLNTRILLSLVTVIALNHAVVRISFLRSFTALFWSIIVLDIVCGSAVLIMGLPGFAKFYPVSLMMGMLFFYHVAVNLRERAAWQREARQEALREQESNKQALLSALGETSGDDEPPKVGPEL